MYKLVKSHISVFKYTNNGASNVSRRYNELIREFKDNEIALASISTIRSLLLLLPLLLLSFSFSPFPPF